MAFAGASVPLFRRRSALRENITTLRASAERNHDTGRDVNRREFAGLLSGVALSFALPGKRAEALNGLHIFPLTEQLTNSYYLMRAAEDIADAQGEARSHPLDLMSVKVAGLTRTGIEQTKKAADALRNQGLEYDAWIWPSIATNSMETAEVLANELNIRRERINPEFSFLDARGLGVLDRKPLKDVMATLRVIDMFDTNGKPPPNEDGTPNESAEQVFVKVRQLVSKLETQYFGENIVIISPDSQPLSILQAAMMDFDSLGKHHDLSFKPGEVRQVVPKVVSPESGEETVKPMSRVLYKPV